jgi:hypothetical protein
MFLFFSLLSILLIIPPQVNSAEPEKLQPVERSVKEEVHIMKVDAATVEAVLKEIQDEYRWKGKISSPTEEFLNSVGPKFVRWQEILSKLSLANQTEDADRICTSIVNLRNHWGPDIFPSAKYNAFARDTFSVGSLQIDAAEFFEPIPYYPGDDKILKYYRFSVYSGSQVIARYHLEYSNILEPFYVLGRADEQRHAQIQTYGGNKPSYWVLKDAVIKDLTTRQTNPGSNK